MKKAFAIFFLLLLFLQAIPVGHFFAQEKSIFYAYVDEDKPDDGKTKQGKEFKACFSDPFTCAEAVAPVSSYPVTLVVLLPFPSLDFTTPPPDRAC